MRENKICHCGKVHEGHICALHGKGLFEEVMHLTDNPTVTCSICLVNANSPAHVCSPATLGGGFKYSDMVGSKKRIRESVDPRAAKEK